MHMSVRKIVRGYGDEQFLFQHVVAFGVDVMQSDGALRERRSVFNIHGNVELEIASWK